MKKNLLIGKIKGTVNQCINIDVTLEKGRLSICGDIRRDSAGQCQDRIKELMINDEIDYNASYTKDDLFKVLEVWDRWHLNDMHPECEHQAVDGTLELARKEVTLYSYKLKPEISDLQNAIKERAMKKLEEDGYSSITKEERATLKLEYWFKSLSDIVPENYSRNDAGYNSTETKTGGWLNFEEFPSVGVLGKPCKVCGYKYGTAWKNVELPADIISYVESL